MRSPWRLIRLPARALLWHPMKTMRQTQEQRLIVVVMRAFLGCVAAAAAEEPARAAARWLRHTLRVATGVDGSNDS